MRISGLGCICILLSIALGACVSKDTYLALESDMVETQRSAELTNQNLIAVQTQKTELEATYRKLQDENRELSERIENLSRQLGSERSRLAEQDQTIREMQDTRRKIEASLHDQIAAQEIRIEEMEGRLKVTFVDKILFDSGSDRIKSKGKASLLNLAPTLNGGKGQQILVEGHTDDIPVGAVLRTKFPSNWELSSARAIAVVRFLQEETGITPDRLVASGCGPYRPVASNDSEEGRSQNRRIEIILVPTD